MIMRPAHILFVTPCLSEGGTHYSSSSNFEVRSTIGGVESIGISTSTSFEVRSGFQYYDDSGPDITLAQVNDGPGADIDYQNSLKYFICQLVRFF